MSDKNKSSNSQYVDLLDEDKPIAGQKFVCLSFISPENIIKDKNLFYFNKFLKQFEFYKSFDKYTQFLNFISYKYNLDFNKLTEDMNEYIKEEKDNLFLTTLDDDYKTYLDKNEDKLQDEYNKLYEFQTNTRGIKVRGVFSTQEEAELRCKFLRDNDSAHDVYVGQVGLWMPFHPEAYKTGKVEYLEKELNELMHQKKKNDEISKDEFKKRIRETKRKAIEENIKKAEKEGNKLMQSINEKDELVNSDRMDVPGKNLLYGDGSNDDIATANLRKQLFESDDVILPTDKNNDHGISRLTKSKQEDNQEDNQEDKQQDKQEDKQEDKIDIN
jgi:hypothetical protein